MNYKNDIEVIKQPVAYKPGAWQHFFADLFKFFSGGFGNILLWAIIATVVIYIVWQIFFSGDSFLFGKNKKVIEDGTATQPTDEEDLANTNWDTLLQHAITNNNTREAVRYSYKRLLQLLQQKGLIVYTNDKTNYEYATELNDTAYKQSFKQLSRQYEYTWYGQYSMPAAAYNDYLALFYSVKKQLGA